MDRHVALGIQNKDVRFSLAPPAAGGAEVGNGCFAFSGNQGFRLPTRRDREFLDTRKHAYIPFHSGIGEQ